MSFFRVVGIEYLGLHWLPCRVSHRTLIEGQAMPIAHPARLVAIAGCCCLFQTSPGNATESVPREDPYASRKVFYESHWQSKIERVLHYIEGVVVSVNVELSPEVEQRVIAEQYSSKVVTVTERVKSIAEVHKPPARLNKKASPPKSSARGITRTEEESEVENLVPRTEITSTNAGLIPEHVSVCVVIPRSYTTALISRNRSKRKKSPNRIARGEVKLTSEKKLAIDIEAAVNSLLPRRRSGTDDVKRVEVHYFEDIRRNTHSAAAGDALPADAGRAP